MEGYHRRIRTSGAAAAAAAIAVVAVVGPSVAHAPTRQVSAVQATGTADPPAARGVAGYAAPGVTAGLRASKASWVYNWDSAPSFRLPRTVRFVPMVWDAAMANPEDLSAATSYGPDLLTFNEPDRADQADLTVEEALEAWPAVQATGLRLSSPAVATGAAEPDGWLDRFMSGARERGLRVDFIAVHWYGDGDFRVGPATQQLRDYLTSVHDRYGLPVWLTEYALLGFSDGQPQYPDAATQARFVSSSTRMLDGLPWLERYAWFALPAPALGPSTGLFRPDGAPTAAGRAYRAAP